MRLTRIEIENFKGIGTRQRIDLKPITLLFGPNSAGKSTILQALHYLREILERGNVDPDRTIAGGLIDLGGFATLVHNHELDRTVTLKVVLDLSDDPEVDQLPLNDGLAQGQPEFSELPIRYLDGRCGRVTSVGLLVDVRWSELEQKPYISRFETELNGEPLAKVESPPAIGRAQLTGLNHEHPLLWHIEYSDEEPEEHPFEAPLLDEVAGFSHEAADLSMGNFRSGNMRLGLRTEFGALPRLDKPLNFDLDPRPGAQVGRDIGRGEGAGKLRKVSSRDVDELVDKMFRFDGLTKILDELVRGPINLVREHLAQMTYIGPLREIPSRNYRPQVTPEEARWAQGLAAWDMLYSDRHGDLFDEVNLWLSGEERLRTTYRLERVEFKEIPVPSAMHQMFERGLNEDDIGDLQELYLSLAVRTEIALRDFEKGVLVAPGDVGVGISQMVPVIVASLRKQDGVLGIEQPELHVHPAIQVGMGDLFIKAATGDEDKLTSGKTLLIETHSEHIMLRLLRRVREQTDGEIPPGMLGLTPDDLSVIYAESSVEGVRFRPLRVSPDGDFVDRWPQGFFAERAEELF